MLASDAEWLYKQILLVHGSMATSTLAESLQVTSVTQRSYANVCGGEDTRGATGHRHPCYMAPNLTKIGTKTSTT